MTCDELAPLLHDLVDGDLSLADTRTVEAHLEGCAGCASRVAALHRLDDELAFGVRTPTPAGLTERVTAHVFATAQPSRGRAFLLPGAFLGAVVLASGLLALLDRFLPRGGPRTAMPDAARGVLAHLADLLQPLLALQTSGGLFALLGTLVALQLAVTARLLLPRRRSA